MKALFADKYGTPEVLSIIDKDKPTQKDNEVLIKVSRSVVTPTDYVGILGEPFVVRLFSGILRPRATPGDVFAGSIEKVGDKVTRFEVGDKVFGTLAPNTGTHAQYITIKETGLITKLPSNLGSEQAVALVDGPLTANAFLQKVAKIKAGHKILINGASGSIGTAAVQLAKHLGAEVTGVCSTKNLDLVQKLGADNVIDYTAEDFTSMNNKYDFIFDTVGKSSFTTSKSVLTENGKYMTTMPSWDIIKSYLMTRIGKQKAVMAATGPFWKLEELEYIKDFAEQGILEPIIDKTYDFENIADAYEYVGKRHKVGSVVVRID